MTASPPSGTRQGQAERNPGMKHYRFVLLAALLAMLLPAAAPAAGKDEAQTDKKDPVIWGEMPAGARTAYIGIHGGTVPVSLLTAGDGSPMIAQVGLTGSDFLNFLRSKGRLEEELVLSDAPVPTEGASALPAPETEPASASRGTTVEGGTAPLSPNAVAEAGTATPPPATVAEGSMPAAQDTESARPAAENATLPAGAPAVTSMPPAENATLPAETTPVLPPKTNTLALAGSPDGDIPVIYATGHAFERMSLIPKNWAPFGLTEKALSVEGEVKVLSTPKKQPRTQKRRR